MHLAISLLGYAPPARPWHGDYCAGILPSLLADPQVERATLLVTPYGRRQWQHLAAESITLQLVEGLDERKRRRFYAERYILPHMLRDLAPDAVFAPLGGALLHPGMRYVYRLASLGYLQEPEHFSVLEQLFYGKTIPASCRSADLIVVDHSALADVAVNRGMTGKDRLRVVAAGFELPGGNGVTAGENAAKTTGDGAHATMTGKYILCLGGDDDHLLPRLLSGLLAHTRLPRGWEDLTFVCLGRQAGSVHGPRLLAIEDAPQSVYASLLQGASAALCLSPGESSLPALRHALGAGLPTIAADTPALRAVAGAGALYVAPHELTETASALAVLLGDQRQRADLSAEALQRSSTTTWLAAARQVLELLQK
ncbi:MAG: hypothetical protein M3R04_00245 [bacterium]|nr:hypothetical protein [bacterium]